MIAVALILIGGIPRGTGLQCAVIRQGPTGDHQPLRGSGPFALDPRLHPAPDKLDLHRPFSPSRTVKCVHAWPGSAWRQSVTDCHGAFGRRPRPAYAGNGASRSDRKSVV